MIQIVLLAAVLAGVSAAALPPAAEPLEPDIERTLRLLNEVGARRRLNTLFPSPQPLRDGPQVGFVNLGTGSLAFQTRDLVVQGPLPIMFGRAYHSGSGWRLVHDAEVLDLGDRLVLVDPSGRHVFTPSDGTRYANRHEPELAETQLERLPGEIRLTTPRLEQRFLAFAPDRYRLVEISDRRGHRLTVSHDARGLRRIASDQGWIEVVRNADGELTGATDHRGRRVTYGNEDGRLVTFTSANGTAWRHRYDAYARLAGLETAAGLQLLSVAYDHEGRVATSVHGGEKLGFEYHTHTTLVTSTHGQTSVPLRPQESSPSITTPALLSARARDGGLEVEIDGQRFTVGFDPTDRAVRIERDADGAVVAFDYDAHGQLTAARFANGTSSRYEWNASGIRTGIRHGDGGRTRYRYGGDGAMDGIVVETADGTAMGQRVETDGAGRIVEVIYSDGDTLHFEYLPGSGDPAAVSTTEGTTRFEYDPRGRLSAIARPRQPRFEYRYADREPDLRQRGNDREPRWTTTPALFRDLRQRSTHWQTLHRPVDVAGVIFDARVLAYRRVVSLSELEVRAAELVNARVFTLFAPESPFEQPSNPLFVPPEYQDINCCLPCPADYPWLCGECFYTTFDYVCYCAATAPEPPPPPPDDEPTCTSPRVDIVSHRFLSKTLLRITYNAIGCPMPKVTFSGPGQVTELYGVYGYFTVDYNPLRVASGATANLTLTPSHALPRTIRLERARRISSDLEIMTGIVFIQPSPAPVAFNQALTEIYERFNVSSIRGYATKIIGGSSKFVSTNYMYEPLPTEIGIWNANHYYHNSLRGVHQLKSMTPPKSSSAIPQGATVREVTSGIDYRSGETSRGVALTTAIHMKVPGGYAMVGLLVNPDTDAPVR